MGLGFRKVRVKHIAKKEGEEFLLPNNWTIIAAEYESPMIYLIILQEVD